MYKYWGFGLNIASELVMPELVPKEFDLPDVTIVIKDILEMVSGDHIVKREFISYAETEYILDVRNVCRYFAGYGNTIYVEPYPDSDQESVRLFLLTNVMAAVICQRGLLPMRSSAIVENGKIYLFLGGAGVGLSSITAQLIKQGCNFFSDEICVLEYENIKECVVGTASYPVIKLWEDSIDAIGADSYKLDFKIRPRLPKYGQFFHRDFCIKSLPIEKVFVLSLVNNGKQICYSKLNRPDAFLLLEKHAFRHLYSTGDSLRSQMLKCISSLAVNIPVIEIRRPVNSTTVQELSKVFARLLKDE